MVIDDMNKILHIKIRTITILSLFILLWARKNFSLEDDGLYISETSGTSLRQYLENKLGRQISIGTGWENQLEPTK